MIIFKCGYCPRNIIEITDYSDNFIFLYFYFPRLNQKMRIFTIFVRLIVFLFLLSIAVKNSELVTVHYYLGMKWEVPMVVVLFCCFAVGALFGYLSCLIKKIHKKN